MIDFIACSSPVVPPGAVVAIPISSLNRRLSRTVTTALTYPKPSLIYF